MAAMLNNPRSVEHDNQNSLRKFPFSDAASCTNGTCVIPAGAIIDAQLYVPGREPGRVWLSSVSTDGKLHFSDADGEFAETAAPAAADTAVPVTFTGDGGPCPGGVVVFGHSADVSVLRAYGGQEFSAGQTELAPAAVSWPGLPGVLGFRLDDGHVVYGHVKMRGENGCVVSTYVENGVGRLRISAIGRTVEAVEATGFITRVELTSDNRHFVVSSHSDHAVNITAAGLALTQDDGIVADREDLCAQVRKTMGTKPSERAASNTSCVCAANDSTAVHTITLLDNAGNPVPDAEHSKVYVLQGGALGKLPQAQIPAPAGYHFTGYFDDEGRRYYRPDGRGVGRFTAEEDITLHAHVISDSSSAAVTFSNYGTLHLLALDTVDYANPIRIFGKDNIVPTIQGISRSAIKEGGSEALADALVNPDTPAGEIHIGLRGLGKASML